MATKRAVVAGTTSVFAEISGFDQLEITVGGLISSSGALVLKGFNNIVQVPGTETLDVTTIDRAGTINIGTTSSTGITVGSGTAKVTVGGDLDVLGNESITGTSTFTDDATFNGDVTIGNDGTDTLNIGGGGGVTATGNPTWNFGTGQVDFGGNVDANAGLDVTGTLNVGGIPIIQSGQALVLGGTGVSAAPSFVSLTTTERDALTPVNGMQIYNETVSFMQVYTGGSWSDLEQGGGSGWTDDGDTVRLTTAADDVAIGVATVSGGGEKLRVVGNVGIQGDIDFETGATRTVGVIQAASQTAGNQLSLAGGAGGDTGGTGAGGLGGKLHERGGLGGAGSATQSAGAGGIVDVRGGDAGAANGGNGGNGGTVLMLGGNATGVRSGGGVTIQGGQGAGAITGSGGIVSVTSGYSPGTAVGPELRLTGGGANSGKGGNVRIRPGFTSTGTLGSVVIGDADALDIALGNATDNTTITQTGSGQVTFTGNVNATAGLDVTTAALTAAAALTVTGGAFTFSGSNIDLDPTGTFDLAMNAGQAINLSMADGLASAFVLDNGTLSFLTVSTAGGAETMQFGNATDNNSFQFLGTGTVSLQGTGQMLQFADDGYINFDERTTDPGTGTDEGALYTKSDGSSTQLFYREEINGTVHQITPAGPAHSEYVGTAGENIDAGEAVNISWDLGNSEARVYKCDGTSTGTLSNAVGIATTTSTTGNSVTVQLTGESIVIPDAQWDAVPANTRAGQAIYMSVTTNGNLTYTLPAGNVTVQQVGNLSIGGTGVCKILINVMVQLKKAA